MDIQQAIIKKIEDVDREGAVRLLREWGEMHGNQRAGVVVLGSVMRKIGEMWENEGKLSLARGYCAAKIVEDALGVLVEDAEEVPWVYSNKGTGTLIGSASIN